MSAFFSVRTGAHMYPYVPFIPTTVFTAVSLYLADFVFSEMKLILYTVNNLSGFTVEIFIKYFLRNHDSTRSPMMIKFYPKNILSETIEEKQIFNDDRFISLTDEQLKS